MRFPRPAAWAQGSIFLLAVRSGWHCPPGSDQGERHTCPHPSHEPTAETKEALQVPIPLLAISKEMETSRRPLW